MSVVAGAPARGSHDWWQSNLLRQWDSLRKELHSMTSTNVATHRAGHEAFNQRDFDAMVKAYADNILWTDRARSLTFRTPQDFKDSFLAGWVQSSTDIRIDDPHYVDAGQTVLCTFT